MLESTPSIQSVCGVAPKTKEVNFSGRGLQAIDMKIIAHELSCRTEVGLVLCAGCSMPSAVGFARVPSAL